MAYSSCKIYSSVHSARRRGGFIAPASSTKTTHFDMQNITNCNANNGKQNMRKTILRNYLYNNALRKTTFLCCKSMVFGVQKPYFYIAKTPFLHCKKGELHYSLWLFCCCFRHSSSRMCISFLAVSI